MTSSRTTLASRRAQAPRRPQPGSRGARRCRLLARLDIAGRLGDLRRDRPLRPSQRRRRINTRSLFDAAFEPSRPARRDYSFKPFGAFAARLLPPAGRPCRASGRPSLEAPQSRIRLTRRAGGGSAPSRRLSQGCRGRSRRSPRPGTAQRPPLSRRRRLNWRREARNPGAGCGGAPRTRVPKRTQVVSVTVRRRRNAKGTR